jgi:hypothetical protein
MLACLSAYGQDFEKSISYETQIRPILKRRCQGCHNPADPGGGLSVIAYSDLLKGGKSGPAFTSEKPDTSLIIKLISGETPSMPKGGTPLTSEEVELFRRWIAEGAQDDSAIPAEDSINPLQPPIYTAPPVITALAYSPDGKTLAVSGFREILLHKSDGSEMLGRLVGQAQRIESLTYSADGAMLCAVGGTPARFGEVQLWNTRTNRLIQASQTTYDDIYGVSLSADGKLLAFGCGDKTARVMSTQDGKEQIKFDNHTDWVFGTAFSQDGTHLVTGGRDGALKLVDVQAGQFIDDINASNKGYGGINCIARHPKADQILSAGIDRVPRLYRIFRQTTRDVGNTDFNLVREFEPQSGSVNAVAFSPDGTRAAIGASSGEVRVYNVADGSRLAALKGDTIGIFTLAFHPNGEELAVAGFDGKVRLFEVGSGKLLKEFVPVPISEKPQE